MALYALSHTALFSHTMAQIRKISKNCHFLAFSYLSFSCYLYYMFTGLIEKVSTVKEFKLTSNGARISFVADFDNVKIGDSIAINGVCLTMTSINGNLFSADVMKETLAVSNLKNLKPQDEINLERAMKLSSRLDGHIVSGHIDTTASVKNIIQDGFSKRISFNCDTNLIIKKGSVAINGVSLTVSSVEDGFFEVSLIPETIRNTNLKNLKIGDIVNIEYDLFAKYIQKFTQNKKESKLTFEFLKENGF